MAYHPKTLQCLGIMQIITGVIAFFLGIASAIVRSDFTSYAGFGIWVGLWILITGVLGFSGARDKNAPNNCILGTFMGFAITACVFCGIMFICYCVALGTLSSTMECYRWNSYRTYYDSKCHDVVSYRKAQAGIGLGSVLLIISMMEFFVALTSSIYCCNAVCCGQRTVATQQTVVYQQQQVSHGTGVTIVSGTGGAVLQPPSSQVIIQQPAQPGYVTVSQPTTYVAGGYPPMAYPPAYTTNTTTVAQPPPYLPPASSVQVTHS